MNKRSYQVTSAVALALGAGFAGQSQALPIAAFAGTPESNRFYVSGATATDNSLTNMMLLGAGDGVCSAGTADLYQATSGSGSLRYRVILCTAASGLVDSGGITLAYANETIAYFKTSTQGSQQGIEPLLATGAAALLPYFNVGAGTGCSAGSATTVSGLQTYTIHTGCTSSVTFNATAEVGISDVNPRLFGFTAADETTLNIATGSQVVFAPTVSLALYRALQTAQGLTLNDTAANVPSLTKSVVSGILTGNIATVDLLANETGTALANADNTLYLCRRANTSGTQRTFARYFLNGGCAADVEGFATHGTFTEDGTTWVDGTFINTAVFAGASSGDVRNCLDGHHDSGDFALGVTSTEATYNLDDGLGFGDIGETSGGDDEWRYVRLNNQMPTLEGTANGYYELYSENTIQQRPGIDTEAVQFRDWLVNEGFTNPAAVALANASFVNTHGNGGLLVVPTGDAPPANGPLSAATLVTTPISAFTRSPGGTPNNCNESIGLGVSRVPAGQVPASP